MHCCDNLSMFHNVVEEPLSLISPCKYIDPDNLQAHRYIPFQGNEKKDHHKKGGQKSVQTPRVLHSGWVKFLETNKMQYTRLKDVVKGLTLSVNVQQEKVYSDS